MMRLFCAKLGSKSGAYFDVCEHLAIRRSRAKRTHQNVFLQFDRYLLITLTTLFGHKAHYVTLDRYVDST